MQEHQEYADRKVYPLVERLVTQTLVARPDLPVPFMVKWLAEDAKLQIPTPIMMMKGEIEELQRQVGALEQRLAKRTEGVWVLAYEGPDFREAALALQKCLKPLQSRLAFARGWRLAFSQRGVPKVEPAFANAERTTASEELHGLALQVPLEALKALDAAEPERERLRVRMRSYDGLEMEGYLYASRPGEAAPATAPSQRLLHALQRGAKEAGLRPEYVEQLETVEAYVADEATLALRQTLPSMEGLEEVSCEKLEDLAEGSEGTCVSILGYVVQVPGKQLYVGSHRGRDVTQRVLKQWRGQPLEPEDELGQPPYPSLESLSGEEREYLNHWLDHYLWASGGIVVGFLQEFREQLELEAAMRLSGKRPLKPK